MIAIHFIVVCFVFFLLPPYTVHGAEGSGDSISGKSIDMAAANSLDDFAFDKFMQSVDKNMPKLQSSRLEPEIASAKHLEKKGAFDPVLSGVNEYQRVQDIFSPGKAKSAIHNETRVDMLTRSGIKVFAGMRLNPNDTKTPFVPTGSAGEYYAGMTVPLLRGLIVNDKAIAEKQADLGRPLSMNIYQSSRLELLLKAAASYWDWVGASKRVAVAKNLLALASERTNQIKSRVDKGDLPLLDIAEAEQEIHRRKVVLQKTEREYQKTLFTVAQFTWNDKGENLPLSDLAKTNLPLLPPEAISDLVVDAGKKRAFDQRPELKRIRFEQEQAKLDLRLAENNRLPGLDAYFLQGADTGFQGIGPVARAGVAMSVPLRQRVARGQMSQAQLKIRKLSLEQKQEKLRIEMEVADSAAAAQNAFNRWVETKSELEKARQVEAGERKRFFAGDSSLFLVNQRERASAEVEMRLIDANVDYLQALAAFKAVTCLL